MKTIRLLFLLFAGSGLLAAATRIEEMIRMEFAVKDAGTACKAAEDFCYRASPAWMKEGSAFKARLLSLTRAPRGMAGKKVEGGEVVWIVLVENYAESDLVPTPRSLLCVRARDGSIVELVPDEKKG